MDGGARDDTPAGDRLRLGAVVCAVALWIDGLMTPDVDPYSVYWNPLTVQERTRLGTVKLRVDAKRFLKEKDPEHLGVDLKFAGRLAFFRWMFVTRRLVG